MPITVRGLSREVVETRVPYSSFTDDVTRDNIQCYTNCTNFIYIFLTISKLPKMEGSSFKVKFNVNVSLIHTYDPARLKDNEESISYSKSCIKYQL